MSWRWRKVFSAGPLRMNLSRGGVGWSWGIPGLRYGISPNGRRYVSFGLPGFGLYWMKYLDEGGRRGEVDRFTDGGGGQGLAVGRDDRESSRGGQVGRQLWRKLK